MWECDEICVDKVQSEAVICHPVLGYLHYTYSIIFDDYGKVVDGGVYSNYMIRVKFFLLLN